MLMNFERLVLTKTDEFYRFTIDYEDVAYLLLEDTFSKAPKEFGELFFEDDFVPEENHILVKIGVRKILSEDEKEFILSFAEGLLSFKPSIDYVTDFFEIDEDIEFDYPKDEGFKELVEKINEKFKSTIEINDFLSFNNILQY